MSLGHAQEGWWGRARPRGRFGRVAVPSLPDQAEDVALLVLPVEGERCRQNRLRLYAEKRIQ